MSAAKSLSSYHDVRLVLDAALQAGGGVYELPTHGKAVHWRMRAHGFRNLLREQKLATSLIPGLDPTTPYDHLELLIEDKPSGRVIIRPYRVKGVLTALNGAVIDLTAKPMESPKDELDAAAADLLNLHGD